MTQINEHENVIVLEDIKAELGDEMEKPKAFIPPPDLVRLFNEEDTYYYISHDGNTFVLANKSTWESLPNVRKSILIGELYKYNDYIPGVTKNMVLHKQKTVLFEYNPYAIKEKEFRNKKGHLCLNTYAPPIHFKSQKAVAKIPKAIGLFLDHLFSKDSDDYKYVLCWIANMVHHGRNLCNLIMIGEQGTGKTVFVENILASLLGEENSEIVPIEALKERFNNWSKTQLIHFSEVSLEREDVINRLKYLSDNQIPVEEKGKDSYKITNYASLVLTSNSIDKVRIARGERRYSIVGMTETPLVKASFIKEHYNNDVGKLISEIESEIEDFWCFLKTLEIDRKMNEPYKNQIHFEGIEEASKNKNEIFIMENVPRIIRDFSKDEEEFKRIFRGDENKVLKKAEEEGFDYEITVDVVMRILNDYLGVSKSCKPYTVYKYLKDASQQRNIWKTKRKSKPIQNTKVLINLSALEDKND
ncbi:Phage associated DNA primase (COG3378) [uncultured Mediterranean phage uvMED]|nr:Phage associated DNA primase (COG3378) [uncultured Mediterranean phage uvMED]